MPRATLTTALQLTVLVIVACSTPKVTRPYKEQPPPSIQPTVLIYADSDAFDSLLESSLLNRDPAILIQTASQKPDWGPRLNAWIAAWNMGGPVVAKEPLAVMRMQAPLPSVVINGDSIHEFRLLIDDLMGRVNGLASNGSAWWKIDSVQRSRVALLKPYNLRFHIDSAKNIQLILFNGQYPSQHRAFVHATANPDEEGYEEWARTYSCSRCRENTRAGADPQQ